MLSRFVLLSAAVVALLVNPAQADVRLTAATVYATDIDGNLKIQERWNTIATHPAWDVWIKDGPLPGNNLLNTTSGAAPDRWIDIPLAPGEHTFSFGVEHFADLCCEGYGLNLFINGSPTAANGEEEPQLTGWTEPDLNLNDGQRPTFQAQNPDGTSMGFPLKTFPPAFLDYEGEDFEVELLDFVIYSNQAGWNIDVHSQGSALGPFTPDGRPDVVGQFTLKVTSTGGIVGDFNGNGALDAADMNLLSAEVRTGANTARFDLTGDRKVDQDDRGAWVDTIRKTYFGDSNLDGEFNSSDFVFVFGAGQYEDASNNNSGWAEGDWNGDADFGSSDFVTAFTAGGYELGPRAATAAVPEPSAMLMALLASLALATVRRRHTVARV